MITTLYIYIKFDLFFKNQLKVAQHVVNLKLAFTDSFFTNC